MTDPDGTVLRVERSEDGSSVETKELCRRDIAHETLRAYRDLHNLWLATVQCEMFYANADKARAEAQAILATVRAESAKEIEPIDGEGETDADADDEVMALLRGR